MAGEIITDFEPAGPKKNITTDFQPVIGSKGEFAPGESEETYLTQGKPLTIVDKVMDYLGIKPTPRRKTTPLELEAVETKKEPFQIKQEVFGTGPEQEVMKVFQRGLAGASFGMTDLVEKFVKGEIERPETIPGTIGGSLAELTGFILGPFKAANLITGTRLAPTAQGLKGIAQMMTKGAADLGIASGLSSIIPSVLESERLTDAGLNIVKSTGMGALIGAIFPTFGLVPTKPLRIAIGMAVMDKIRAGTNEWFTIDDVITGVMNGEIDKKELALKTYDYLLDLYFISHVPSMGKQIESLKHNEAIRELSKNLNAEEVEQTIIGLEKNKLVPGSEKRESTKIDETPINLKDTIEEGPISEVISKRLENGEPIDDLKQKLVFPTPEKLTEIDQRIAEQEKKIEALTPAELRLKEAEEKGIIKKVGEITVGEKPSPSPVAKGEQLLPGMKVGLEFPKEGKEVNPTLEGTPLGEVARKAEIEKVQPGLEFGKKSEEPTIVKTVVPKEKGKREFKDWDIVDAIDFLTEGKGISKGSIEMESLKQREIGMYGRANPIKKGGVGFDTLVEELNWLGFTGDTTELGEQLLAAMEARKDAARRGEKLIKESPEMMAERVWNDFWKHSPDETLKPGSLASIGKYAQNLPYTMDLPEIVAMAKELMGGKYPKIVEKLRAAKGAASGVFWPQKGEIGLVSSLFKDINQARWVLSHEVGHLVDYLPELPEIVKRGNILGRIGTLKKYLKEMIESAPPDAEQWLLTEEGQKEWKKIRAKIRKEARHDAVEEGIDPKEDKQMFNDFVSGRYAELKAEWIGESGFISKQEIMDELKALSQAIKPFDEAKDPKFTEYRFKSSELYADAISSLVNNPYLIKETAPIFYDSFFAYLDRKPEVKKLYDELQDAIHSGEIYGDRVRELRESFRKADEKYQESVRKQPGIIDDIKTGIIDKDNFLLGKIKNIGEKNINPGDNPRYKVEEMRYRTGEAEAYMADISNQVIKPLEKAGVSWEDFREWAFHQRVINERGEIANPMGWHPDRSKQRIAEMEASNPAQMEKIKNAHDAFWRLRQDYFIDRAKALNIFSPDLMEKIQNTEYYATFDVQDYFNNAYGRTTGGKIYHQIGTLKEIGDPIAATIMKDISLMSSMSRIKAARSVIDLFKNYYSDEIQEADTAWTGKGRRILEPKEKGQYLLVDIQEGKAKGYYVPEEIKKTFEENPGEAGLIVRVLRKTVQPFRIAFTELNYGFWLFNIHRDYFRAARNLPDANVLNFAKYWVEGLKPGFRSSFGIPDEVVDKMLKNDMLISITDTKGMRPEDMQIERLLKKYHIVEDEWNNNILKPFGKAFNFLTNIGRAFERTTKIGSYQYLKDKFPEMSDEEVGHIVRTMGGSPDFLRKGAGYDIYNNILLFSNAMKEGYRGDYEAFSDRPGQFMWKTAQYNFIPKILMKAGAIGLLGAGIKEIFDKMTEYDKTNYITIPLGLTPTGKAVYWRIPQDETGRLLSGVMWKLLGAEFNQIKGGLIDYMAGQAPTVHPGLDVMVDVTEYFSGNNPYDSFRGREAIPDLVWKAQDFRTHEAFAKYIANKIGFGLVHRFKSDNDVEVRSELEKLIDFPIMSNILGRFIKVTDYGEKEHIKQDILEPIQEKRAREILDVHEAIQRLVTGEKLTDKDVKAIMNEEMKGNQVVTKNIIVNLGRRYGTAYTEALISASTKEEKLAILQELMKKQQQGGER